MKIITSVIITVAFASACCSSSNNAPLIRNMYRGGDHFEGPHWSQAENALYWVDISGQTVYRLDGQTGNTTSRYISYGPVTFVVTVRDNPGVVVLSARTDVYLLHWQTKGDGALRLLTTVDLGHPDNRCNDAKCDAKGRLWLGTMGKETSKDVEKDQGTLYMIDHSNYLHPEVKVRPVSVSNGLAWTADNKFMFYIDSPSRNIDVFDYNLQNGSIRNRRTLFSFQANNVTGVPDGMTIDKDDNLWVACYGGGKVIKIDSRAGKLLEHHKLPASKVTSVTWGGHDLSILYVTTRKSHSPSEAAQEPEGGSLFAIEGTGTTGAPGKEFVFPEASQY